MKYLATAVLVALPISAQAYDSRCYIDGEACAEGPQTARGRWVGESDEHRELFERAMDFAGLPPETKSPFLLEVFTAGDSINVAGDATTTLIPATPANITRVEERRWTVAEFAQLPDFSYSLFDWALGNETCPADMTDPVACHLFAGHMGALNSNHFLPQAQGFYLHYHALAMSRAAECKSMNDALGSEASRFTRHLFQCEKEALALEAIAQHYLQDAWSSGHMWARWGSPNIDDFSSLLRAVTIAITSGVIHGARAIIQPSSLPDIVLDADDALCAPQDDVQWQLSSVGQHPGLGDLYLPQLLGDTEFTTQHDQLFACSVASLRAVYGATGGIHGDLVAPTGPGTMSVDPTGDECFGQRVTNEALFRGFGIDVRVATGPLHIPITPEIAGALVLAGQSASMNQPAPAAEFSAVSAQYAFDMTVLSVRLEWNALFHPEETTMASGEIGTLLGMAPNSSYVTTPPAPYADPDLPWSFAENASDTDPQAALLRTFHRGHAKDWCDAAATGSVEPEDFSARIAVLNRAIDDLPEGNATRTALEGDRGAACAACVEFAGRHLRIGADAGNYDTNDEPLCALLSPQAPLLYEAGNGRDDAATRWCGCPNFYCPGQSGGTLEIAGEDFETDSPTGPLSQSGSSDEGRGDAYADFGLIRAFSTGQSADDTGSRSVGNYAEWTDTLIITADDPALDGTQGNLTVAVEYEVSAEAIRTGGGRQPLASARLRVGDEQVLDSHDGTGPAVNETRNLNFSLPFTFGGSLRNRVQVAAVLNYPGNNADPASGRGATRTRLTWKGITSIRDANGAEVSASICSTSGTNWRAAQ